MDACLIRNVLKSTTVAIGDIDGLRAKQSISIAVF